MKDQNGLDQTTREQPAPTAEDLEKQKKIRIMDGILEHMDQSADIFSNHSDIDCYVDATILSVNSEYRGHGIGSKLFNGLIDLCKTRNIPYMKVFCSSTFTSRICEKLGMKLVHQIHYRDIPMGDMTAPDVPEPHSIGRVFTCDLRA